MDTHCSLRPRAHDSSRSIRTTLSSDNNSLEYYMQTSPVRESIIKCISISLLFYYQRFDCYIYQTITYLYSLVHISISVSRDVQVNILKTRSTQLFPHAPPPPRTFLFVKCASNWCSVLCVAISWNELFT